MGDGNVRRARISLDQYRKLCEATDVSPNYHPDFLEYYFSRLGMPPRIIGCSNANGELVAAYPILFHSVFPTPLHKRLLPKRMRLLGDIGQPESLFPVVPGARIPRLNRLSPVTSPLLRGSVRGVKTISLRKISIATPPSLQRVHKAEKALAAENGAFIPAQDLSPSEFGEVYSRLHAERWASSTDDLVCVRQQIVSLFEHVDGGVLLFGGEPVAALLAFVVSGRTILYFDFVNSGVRLVKTNRASAGTILLFKCISRAQETAASLGKSLRFSLGYDYGANSYKRQWGVAEDTFLAI